MEEQLSAARDTEARPLGRRACPSLAEASDTDEPPGEERAVVPASDLAENHELLQKLYTLQECGVHAHRTYDLSDSLEEMRREYARLKARDRTERVARFLRDGLCAAWLVLDKLYALQAGARARPPADDVGSRAGAAVPQRGLADPHGEHDLREPPGSVSSSLGPTPPPGDSPGAQTVRPASRSGDAPVFRQGDPSEPPCRRHPDPVPGRTAVRAGDTHRGAVLAERAPMFPALHGAPPGPVRLCTTHRAPDEPRAPPRPSAVVAHGDPPTAHRGRPLVSGVCPDGDNGPRVRETDGRCRTSRGTADGPSGHDVGMRSSPADASALLARVRELLRCPGCGDPYGDPRMLPACGHTLCARCLGRCGAYPDPTACAGDGGTLCPLCGARSSPTDAVPRNYAMQAVIDIATTATAVTTHGFG